MSTRTQHPVIDWSGCDLVEVVPERLSGVPILKDTRVQADSIVENHDGGSSVEEIAYNFPTLRRIGFGDPDLREES